MKVVYAVVSNCYCVQRRRTQPLLESVATHHVKYFLQEFLLVVIVGHVFVLFSLPFSMKLNFDCKPYETQTHFLI